MGLVEWFLGPNLDLAPSWHAWFTLAVVALAIGTMVLTRYPHDVILVGCVTLLILFGIIDAPEALAGLANEGMVTVAVLFVVVAGLRETGAIGWIVFHVLGRPASLVGAQIRLIFPVLVTSAAMNNTPVVAMLIPAVSDWSRRLSISASKLLIPLSYASILGGTCTVIGTSTNLVVNGLLQDAGYPGLAILELAWIGGPSAVVGSIYLLLFSRMLLPDRIPVVSHGQDLREYTIEMLVASDSPMAGKRVDQAGLRNLPGVFLAEIEREGHVLPAVSPDEVIQHGDRLIFVGVVEAVVDLLKTRGLTPATDQIFKLSAPRDARCFVEAVVSDQNPVVGLSIRAGEFRTQYGAVVLAVARGGQRIQKKIGDIVLQPGDTLLLETRPNFVKQHRDSRDFFLVSQIEDSRPPRHERAGIAVVILVGMVLLPVLGVLSMLKSAMLAAGLMILTRCCTAQIARRSVDWQILVVIAAAFGIGRAIQASGLASMLAGGMIGLAGQDPAICLIMLYLTTMLFTELVTNNAAANLTFPIAINLAASLGVNLLPFAVTIMMAASASFSTPIGYQTNLMVYGPGGYRFTDYMRIGIPLNLIMGMIATTLIPRIWGF